MRVVTGECPGFLRSAIPALTYRRARSLPFSIFSFVSTASRAPRTIEAGRSTASFQKAEAGGSPSICDLLRGLCRSVLWGSHGAGELWTKWSVSLGGDV
jgi:hypothetical protein